MAMKTSSGSCRPMAALLVSLLLSLLLLSGGHMKATSGFRWPQFLFCLPGCLVGDTCFLRAYKKCMDPSNRVGKGSSGEFCVQAAQYYCDIGHMPWKPGRKTMLLEFRKAVVEQYDPVNQY